MGQIFEVKMPEVGFVIHTRREMIINRMKLDNRMVHTIEACLVHEIKAISVA